MPDKLTAEAIEKALHEFAKMKPLNVVSEDATGCCAELRKALRAEPSIATWTCPKCGLKWLPRNDDNDMRIWEAFPLVMVWKR